MVNDRVQPFGHLARWVTTAFICTLQLKNTPNYSVRKIKESRRVVEWLKESNTPPVGFSPKPSCWFLPAVV